MDKTIISVESVLRTFSKEIKSVVMQVSDSHKIYQSIAQKFIRSLIGCAFRKYRLVLKEIKRKDEYADKLLHKPMIVVRTPSKM